MLIFDAHCDILSKIGKPSELLVNNRHWDIERASRYGAFIQVFATFADDEFREFPHAHMRAQMEMGLQAGRLYPDKLKFIRTREELLNARKGGVYALLGAEGTEVLKGSLKMLEELYKLGLRIMTLVWNYDNEVCDSVAGQRTHNGLSAFGHKVVKRMEELGMVVDLSHASDKSFEDVLSIAARPLTASHSNARAVLGHRRNLTDFQIKQIAASGGVVGINLYSPFLSDTGNADVLSIIKHIEHITGLVGTKAVGLGCDFDGMDRLPDGIKGVESIENVMEALGRMNYSQQSISDIAGNNFLRLFTEILK